MIEDAVIDGWALPIAGLRYVPEGAGAYHWIAHGRYGERWFLTCDDLTTKPWLGSEPDSVFAGLLTAYRTAISLRTAGLVFVAAPVPSGTGEPCIRIDQRHTVAVFEYVAGKPGHWGQPIAADERRQLVTMLAGLHAVAPAAPGPVRRGLEVPDRDRFEDALDDVGHRWLGGPLSEPARRELAAHLDLVVDWLGDLDRFAARHGATDAVEVVTHGEPHPGNIIGTGNGPMLVDWDTVALARPERDLWMMANSADPTLLTAYGHRTGIAIDREALLAYRLLWALSDLAAFSLQLRCEHHADADAHHALAALRSILDGREPAPYGA